ncbi:MAG: cellulase family glycosylhydrolase [Oscillospiraceae bacterium]|jgi:endoglucanase|nr:cellulase family glycosylhydrolase [Oscillospiraceae bacterium]
MKKRILSLTLALVLTLTLAPFPPAARAAAFTPVTGAEMLENLLLGINIGNTLEARPDDSEHHGLETELYWGEAEIHPEHFKVIAAKGFTGVRIPVSWEPHMDKDYHIDREWMDRVQQCVDWAFEAGLYVIINAHHEDGFYKLVDSDNYNEAKKELTAIWEQASARFKDYSEKLIFEVMNEPNLAVQGGWIWDGWDPPHVSRRLCDYVNRLNMDSLQTIRASGGNNEKRVVILAVPGANTSAVEFYQPPDDPYTMLGVFVYPGDSVKPVRKAVEDGVPVLVKEIAPLGEMTESEQLKWTEEVHAELAELGVPSYWWNCGDSIDSPILLDRFTCTWPHRALLNAVFAAYGRTPGEDYKPDLPPLLPYELAEPFKDGEFTFWNIPRHIRRVMEKMVVELDGNLTGGYMFARFYPSEWAQYADGDGRITLEEEKIIFDLRGLEGDIVGFAAWGAGNTQKIKRVYLDTWEGALPTDAPGLATASGWARGAVNAAYGYGILPEALQNNYQQDTTRAEFCALAVALIEKLTGKTIEAKETFTDTTDINVRKIAGLGIVTGRGGGVFDPNGGISRQEAAIILEKVARKGLLKELPEGEANFPDMDLAYSDATRTAIRKMRGGSVMSGRTDGTFDPNGTFSREESISTMVKLWDWFEK